MPRHHTLDIGSDQIAVVTLNHADLGVNVLTSDLLSELEQTFGRLKAMKEVRGLLIRSGKPKQFIAGANIDEIHAITDLREAYEKSAFGQCVFAMIERLPYPSVAVIDGPCLGGGLELALACTYRVAGDGPHVRLSLPEVRLGIIPGFGGTQRLPKIVGLMNALDLIVSSKTLDGRRAAKIGLADDVAASEILEQVAKQLLISAPRLKRPTQVPAPQKLLLKLPFLRMFIFKKARQRVIAETKGQYPAPLAALDVVGKTYGKRRLDGYEIEAQKVAELIVSEVSKSLIHIFHASEEIRKEKYPEAPRPIGKVGLLGAGVMGGGLAQLIATRGRSVRMRDIALDALNKGMQTVFELNQKDLTRRRINLRECTARNALVSGTTDWTGFQQTDLVIEAVVENLEVKQQVFQALGEKSSPETVLATNTSGLSITEIGKTTAHPERVIGLHFFNPVSKMPLVEVIRGEKTSSATVSTTVAFSLALGKTPIVVANRPGFLVNRILGIYLMEALRAAEEKIPIREIDDSMLFFGMPMGPFELMDEIGIDVLEKVGIHLKNDLPDFPAVPKLLATLRGNGRLGKKNGKGFYLHGGKRKKLDEAYLGRILGIAPKDGNPSSDLEERATLSDRFVLLMVNEAARCLEAGVTSTSRDIDIGMVMGTGFAPFRGGLAYYANRRGIKEIARELEKLAPRLGEHFRPVPRLREIAASGGRL
ncbi:MAG: 3-hydroxyacyl-CoA dehydrogenase NAD-binding domain-containing protein [Pseudomonadota bacterium]